MNEHEVFFVLDEFHDDLWALSRAHPVWLVASAHNTRLAKEVWMREPEEPTPMRGVTTFDGSGDRTADLYGFLGTIDEHHGSCSTAAPWSAIHVRGVAPEDVDADTVADALGAQRVRITSEQGGFVIRRE